MPQRRATDKAGSKTGPYDQCPAYLSHDSVATLHETLKKIEAQNDLQTESLKEVKEMLGVWKDTKAVGRAIKFFSKVLLGLAAIGGALTALWSGGSVVFHKFWP